MTMSNTPTTTDPGAVALVAQEGVPFPTVPFPALEDGRPVSIAAFRGKKIILHVFASW